MKFVILYGVYDGVNVGVCVLQLFNYCYGYVKVVVCFIVVCYNVEDEKWFLVENECINYD